MSVTLLLGRNRRAISLLTAIRLATQLAASDRERYSDLLHLIRRTLENDVGEHSSVRCRWQVRAEADAHVKRFVEVEGDWWTKLVHGFALKTDEDRNRIAMFFDSDTLRFDPGQSAPEPKLGVLH